MKFSGSLKFVGIAALVIGLVGSWKIWTLVRPQGEPPVPEAETVAEEAPTRVVLSPEKYGSAGIRTADVARQAIQPTRIVPGRIDYDGLRRVDLKASVDVVIRKVLAKPGDVVKAGARLAALDSPEIGLVRAEVQRNKANLRISNQAVEFAEEVAASLTDLLKALRERPNPKVVEEIFDRRVLGEYRQQILSAYSRYALANELWEDIQPMIEKGSVSAQMVKQRETNRQIAKEDYLSVCEQVQFVARQESDKARLNRDYDRRLVEVNRRKLRSLLGAFVAFDEGREDSADEGDELTQFFLIAPFDGTVEQRLVAESQRLAAGAPAFVIANIETLWVTADIRESDWQALALGEGQMLRVKVPAAGSHEFEARVDFVGREVDRETRAVPLIAVIDNGKKLLKPGMFAWVSIAASAGEEALAVPPGAVQTHDGRTFVFVEESARTFARVDVTLGTRTRDWVAIERGLSAGQRVVTEGAFLLKSELLLERDEE